MRSLSPTLLKIGLLLAAAVALCCLYTWQQLEATRLLDRIDELRVARERALQSDRLAYREVREARTRESIEQAAARQGLVPVGADRLVLVRVPGESASPAAGSSAHGR